MADLRKVAALPVRRQFDPERLAGMLQARGWTQQDLARRTGIAGQQINSWVRGRTKPEFESVAVLAEALHEPMEAFLTAREEVPA
jgi:transcriptional regulator with XRE-family HTH domain